MSPNEVLDTDLDLSISLYKLHQQVTEEQKRKMKRKR